MTSLGELFALVHYEADWLGRKSAAELLARNGVLTELPNRVEKKGPNESRDFLLLLLLLRKRERDLVA